MKFTDLDNRMRMFETSHDHCVMPGIHMVVRLDGRGFTKLTRNKLELTEAADNNFAACMDATTRTLMESGFKTVYGYTQSDEISILLHVNDDTFKRKERKIISILASEASVKFSKEIGQDCVFDARISQLPTKNDVVDYFRWRGEDALRNSLNSHCYWVLRNSGMTASQATKKIYKRTVPHKHDLLMDYGINFNDLEPWKKRGSGYIWELEKHLGTNPKTGQRIQTLRNRLNQIPELPMGEDYSQLLRDILDDRK